VGAVVGMVDRVFRAVIRPTMEGQFTLHSEESRKEFESVREAIKYGKGALEIFARDSMRKDYVKEPLFDFTVDERTAQSKTGESVYLETVINLRATGRPDVGELAIEY